MMPPHFGQLTFPPAPGLQSSRSLIAATIRRFSSSFSRGELVMLRSSIRPGRSRQAESSRSLPAHRPESRFLMAGQPVCDQALSPFHSFWPRHQAASLTRTYSLGRPPQREKRLSPALLFQRVNLPSAPRSALLKWHERPTSRRHRSVVP